MTLVNPLFGLTLLGGLYFGRPLLKLVLGGSIKMDDDGWRKLTLRWGLFFLALAILNEIVWRTVATDIWVNFKVFGLLPLTLVFALSQAPLMTRHMPPEAEQKIGNGDHSGERFRQRAVIVIRKTSSKPLPSPGADPDLTSASRRGFRGRLNDGYRGGGQPKALKQLLKLA